MKATCASRPRRTKQDFPYDRDEEAQVTRREFCNFLGLTSAASFSAPAASLQRPRSTRESQSRSPPLE